MTTYIQVGFMKKPFGVRGEIKLQVKEQYLEDILQCTVIFVELQGAKVPYFVEKMDFSNALISKFEDLNNREDVEGLAGKAIFLREEDLLAEEERQFEVETLHYAQYTGYLLKDVNLGDIATIEEIIELPQQEMAVIVYQNKEIMIPLNEQLIKEIDEVNQFLLLELPEGILNL